MLKHFKPAATCPIYMIYFSTKNSKTVINIKSSYNSSHISDIDSFCKPSSLSGYFQPSGPNSI